MQGLILFAQSNERCDVEPPIQDLREPIVSLIGPPSRRRSASLPGEAEEQIDRATQLEDRKAGAPRA